MRHHDRRQAFDLFASQAVINEAGGGDETVASLRLKVLEELPLLDITEEVSMYSRGARRLEKPLAATAAYPP
jgi:hypothetical protein